jgi:uncharacterized membrane protein
MAECPRCGSIVSEDAAYCSKCGMNISSGKSALPDTVSGLSSNTAAALSYLLGFVTGVIFLSIEPHKRNPFIRFHAFQSICYSVCVTLLWILWNNIAWVGFYNFGFFWIFLRLMAAVVSLGFILFGIFLMYKAYINERYMIPILGEIALKLAEKEE